jgi:hypothetical protein
MSKAETTLTDASALFQDAADDLDVRRDHFTKLAAQLELATVAMTRVAERLDKQTDTFIAMNEALVRQAHSVSTMSLDIAKLVTSSERIAAATHALAMPAYSSTAPRHERNERVVGAQRVPYLDGER